MDEDHKLFGDEVIVNNEYVGFALKIFGCIGFLFFNFSALVSKKIINFIMTFFQI